MLALVVAPAASVRLGGRDSKAAAVKKMLAATVVALRGTKAEV